MTEPLKVFTTIALPKGSIFTMSPFVMLPLGSDERIPPEPTMATSAELALIIASATKSPRLVSEVLMIPSSPTRSISVFPIT